MPRIPVIEQTTNAAMPGGMPRAQAFQEPNPMGASMEGLSHAAGHYADVLQAKDNADAIANTGKPLSDADVHWKQYLVDTSAQTQDGGMVKQDDGTYVGLRAKAEKDFDQWSTSFMEGIKNPKAKVYAQDHISRLRTNTLDSALTFEAHAGMANRADKVDQAVTTWAGAAAKDDSSVKDLILSAKTMIANSGFDEATRNKKAQQATDMIVDSAVMGNIQRNPQASKAALVARYGVDPTAPKPGAAPAAADPAASSGFDQAVAFTLKAEGGLNKSDTNGTPSNYGINQKAHPEVDVKNLTKDQAAGIYKKDYWDFIGGDDLAKTNPALAMAAFDTAALNKGKAKEFLAKANGDAGTFMDLRENFLKSLVTENPAKYGKYEKAWNNRNADLRSQMAVAGSGAAADATAVGTPAAPPPAPPASFSPALGDLVGQLSPEKLPTYIGHATTLANQQQSLARSQLESAQADHVTAFRNGDQVAKPLTLADYVAGYGPAEGTTRFDNYRAIQQMGGDISTMKGMPPDQMNNLVEHYKPDANMPGYALANERYRIMIEARDHVNQARFTDPMAYAMQAKIGDAAPLNLQNPDEFGKELAKRQGIATTMQNVYQTPFSLLTKGEVTAMTNGFAVMTTQQKQAALGQIQRSVTNPAAYLSVMGQIAPDSPVTAMAGVIMNKARPVIVPHMFGADESYTPHDVAGLILEGEALINPTKGSKEQDGRGKTFPMPKEQDMRKAFDDVVGKSYAGAPRVADFDYQAVKAYYAGKASRTGDISGETNQKVLKEAITAVTGGVSDVNGDVIRPWGMSDRRFKDGVQTQYSAAIDAAGLKGTPVDNFGAYSLQKISDMKYMLKTGTGTLTDKAGNPIVLDLAPVSEQPGGDVTPRAIGVSTNGGRGWSGTIRQAPMGAAPAMPDTIPATPAKQVAIVKPSAEKPRTR